jgi:hypothetical protein
LSNYKWQVGPVKLANGFDAVIHRFCENRQRYIGERTGTLGGIYAAEWNIAGEHTISGIGDPLLNLAPPPKKKVRIQTLLVVYGNGKTCNFGYSDRERAVIEAKRRGFALIEIDREVEEGEGL